MSNDGVFHLKFNEKIQVPDFITNNFDEAYLSKLDGAKEELGLSPKLHVSEIDVSRDIMQVRFILKSQVDVDKIQYYLGLSEWTEDGLKLFFNFSEP